MSTSADDLKAGVTRFRISTTAPTDTSGGGNSGSGIQIFRLTDGTLSQLLTNLLADLTAPHNAAGAKQAADAITYVQNHALFVGGAQVLAGSPLTLTTRLSKGTYYVIDVAQVFRNNHFTSDPLRLRVEGDDAGGPLPESAATVTMTAKDRFTVWGELPASGTVLYRNEGKQPHFADFQPVKPGTTDTLLQNGFNALMKGNPPPSDPSTGPAFGMGVLSPDQSATLTYDTTPGTYALECFVTDDQTGLPHAFMGMHRVVSLEE